MAQNHLIVVPLKVGIRMGRGVIIDHRSKRRTGYPIWDAGISLKKGVGPHISQEGRNQKRFSTQHTLHEQQQHSDGL